MDSVVNNKGSKKYDVIVAISGGVDSAVAMGLLRDQGRRVLACHLDFDTSAAARAEAESLARSMGIDYHCEQAAEQFEQVLKYFASQYASGRTPNPCGMCNRICKFAILAELADSVGAEFIATGHHVIKLPENSGGIIARSAAADKDQTYALFNVKREILQRCVFPIGTLADKQAVRDLAASTGISVAEKPDSQDMCFAPDGNYEDILRKFTPQALTPGDIVDTDGNVLGQHKGIGLYTIGQRRGLGVATGEPAYVCEIDAEKNIVRLGTRQNASGRFLIARDANWHAEIPAGTHRLMVQVRYGQRAVEADVEIISESEFRVHFDSDIHAITPGQAAVVYDGDTLLGGGWIVSTDKPDHDQ